ncbi:MAG: ribonuclease HII [Candidatus Hydrogenedentes bacterium]|nr:ribonuclease HII [Candidatus Hydrogenedentota bacterium]
MVRPSLESYRAAVAGGPPYAPHVLAALRTDTRSGARSLYAACVRHQERHDAEQLRLQRMLEFEDEAHANGFARVAGVDEAGRGPLAGPIVAAAVVLSEPIAGLNDSKQLTEAQREELFTLLHRGDNAIAVTMIDPERIDLWGIQSANYAAMAGSVAKLDPIPEFLLVDGFQIKGCAVPQKSLVKGDSRSLSIAAASIVAKVVRDRTMMELDRIYPEYGFARHKGYGTADHIEAIRRHGPCPAHRKSFAPISDLCETAALFEPLVEGMQ